MANDHWTYVMEEATLREGTVAPVYPLGVNLVMARIDGQVFALAGRCPHMGCPIFMGTLNGTTITCPCHDWRFDVRTGYFLDAPELRLKLYQTRTEGGKLYVAMS
jgi:3-phenylpropionate/trans-cinnamate dioxygenase ferredoxin subunit